MQKTEWYIFVLSLLLIAAAYYAGLTTDAKAVTAGAVALGQTITGRDASNKFAAYPANG